jgi:CHRD domain
MKIYFRKINLFEQAGNTLFMGRRQEPKRACTIFRPFQLFHYLAHKFLTVMRITRLTIITILVASAFVFNSCDDRVKVDVIRKTGLALSGTQEVPQKPGPGAGTMDVEYNKSEKRLYYKVTWSSLSGAITGYHLHGRAKRGFNAPVIQSFSGFPAAASGTFSGSFFLDGVVYTESDLMAGEYYINIHTALNPGGEIRGQIELQ